MRMAFRWLGSIALLFLASLLPAQNRPSQVSLHEGWAIQSACKLNVGGEIISTAAFKSAAWYPTTVPMTVVAALVNDKLYPDPYYGMNLRSLPGMAYPIGTIFAKQAMPDGSPFKCAWWYRTQFRSPVKTKAEKVWLHFDGINYRANIWLNGHLIAGPDQVAGAWRTYEFEVSRWLMASKPNVL